MRRNAKHFVQKSWGAFTSIVGNLLEKFQEETLEECQTNSLK